MNLSEAKLIIPQIKKRILKLKNVVSFACNDNQGYCRIGWDVASYGNVTGGRCYPIFLPGWFGSENQEAVIAIADVNGAELL